MKTGSDCPEVIHGRVHGALQDGCNPIRHALSVWKPTQLCVTFARNGFGYAGHVLKGRIPIWVLIMCHMDGVATNVPITQPF